MRSGGSSRCKIVDEIAVRRRWPVITASNTGGNCVHETCRNDVAPNDISDVARTGSYQARTGINHSSRNLSHTERIVNRTSQDWSPYRIDLPGRPSQQRREVPGSFRSGRHRTNERCRCRRSQAFVVSEEIQFVLLNRAADSTAKLIPVKIGLCCIIEIISRVEIAVAVELECVSVESVGPGLRDNVNYVAAAETILRCESAGLNFEFLNIVYGRNVNHTAPVKASVPSSIEQILCSVKEGSSESKERNVLIRAAGNAWRADNLQFRRVADRRVQYR